MTGQDQTKSTTHEVFSREEKIVVGSDRSFGFVMARGSRDHFCSMAGTMGIRGHGPARLASLFLAAALLHPPLLTPLNRLWFKFGLLLHKVVNPIVMGLVFYGTVLPTGLVMRALGKDLLRLKRDARGRQLLDRAAAARPRANP